LYLRARISRQLSAAAEDLPQSEAFALVGLLAAFGVGVALENEMAVSRQCSTTAIARFPAGVVID